MTDVGLRLREATPADDEAIAAVAQASPDGGAVRFSPVEHVPARLAGTGQHEYSTAVVAEVDGRVVGAARLSTGTCRFNGGLRRYGLLHALMVHPAHRGAGIGTALARWRSALARQRDGDDVLLVANIQAGNAASTAAARRWVTEFAGEVVVAPVPMRRKRPRARADLSVRPVADADLDEVAAALTAQRHNLALPWDAARLRSWLAAGPLDSPVNHYRVVTDRRGRLLAGLGLREQGRLQELVVQRMPPGVRVANRVVRVVPRDGRMRNVAVDKLWYAPGQLDAARYLWELTRWQWRDRGSGLLSTHDPRSPVPAVLRTPRWLPTTRLTVALRSDAPIDAAVPIEPLL